MKLIRKSVFETNSSSSHSISLGKEENKEFVLDTLYPNENGIIYLKGGEFGWEWDKYNDALTKANYCAVASLYDENIKDNLIQVIKDRTLCEDVIIKADNDYESVYYSYIDHESTNVAPKTYQEIDDFVFNKNSWLFTGNDNSKPNPTFYYVDEYKDGKVIPVTFKYEIQFPTVSVINCKFVNYPTDEDLNNLVSSFRLRYNKSKDIIETNSYYWFGDETYYERDYSYDQKIDNGCIVLINSKELKKIEKFISDSVTGDKIYWQIREQAIQQILQQEENIYKIPFIIKEL